MEKLSINACPVCGGTHLKRVMTCTDFYASGEQFELYSCDDCSFTFTQGVPVEAEIGKYYETPDYISHTDTRKGAMNNIYHYVRSYNRLLCRYDGASWLESGGDREKSAGT